MASVLRRLGARTAVEKLVYEAVEIERQLKPRHRLKANDVRPHKLAFAPYSEHADRIAYSNAADALVWSKRYDPLDPVGCPLPVQFRANSRAAIRSTRDDCLLCPPDGAWGNLLDDPEAEDELIAQCALLKTNPAKLFALEVHLAGVEEPECFGTITTSWAEHHARLAHLRNRWAQIAASLYERAVFGEDYYLNWISREKSVAEVRWYWKGEPTLIGVGRSDALDQLVALAMEDLN